LELTLGDVNRHGEMLLSREGRRGTKEIIGDGIRRVRRDPEANERCFEVAKSGNLGTKSGYRLLALSRIRTEHLLIHHAADTRLAHRLHHDARITRVGVGGDPGTHAFDQSEASGIE